MRAFHIPTTFMVLAVCIIGLLILMRCPTSYRLRRVDRLLANGRRWEARRVMERIKAEAAGFAGPGLLARNVRGRR